MHAKMIAKSPRPRNARKSFQNGVSTREKSERAGDLSKNRFLRDFALNRKNIEKTIFLATFIFFLVEIRANSNLDKTNSNKLSASLCSAAMECILPAFSNIPSRMKRAFGFRLQSVNVVGSLKFTQTYHDHQPFFMSGSAMQALNNAGAMSTLLAKNLVFDLCV
jgi:hypothetical protein